jgi:hypothetical protein
MRHPDVDKKKERSDYQKESSENNADFADGFVLVHAKAIGESGKDKRPCTQASKIEIHGDIETECILMEDVV